MGGDPTLTVELGKGDAEFLLAQLDGMIHALAEDVAEEDPSMNVEIAREAIDKLLDLVRIIEEAATRVGIVLERVEEDEEDEELEEDDDGR